MVHRGWLLALLVVAGGVALFAAIDGSEPEDSADIDVGITLREVTAEPSTYYGRSVIVSGKVAELAPDDVEAGGDRGGERVPVAAFTVGAELDEQLLVLSEPGGSFDRVRRGAPVQVEGVLYEFGGAALRERVGRPGRFQSEWFADWRGEPALVASSVDRTPPRRGGRAGGFAAASRCSRMIEWFEDVVSSSPWTYPVEAAFVALDGFFPVVPGETVIISAAVLASGGDLVIWLVALAAFAGALAGDNVSYMLGATAGRPAARRLFTGERSKTMLGLRTSEADHRSYRDEAEQMLR